jgi:hypothetical protein
MPDLESILQETKEKGPMDLVKWNKLLAESESMRIAVSNTFYGAGILDPTIGLLIAMSPTVISSTMALVSFAFEAGRLYGRSELMAEIEKK